ncbi:Replication termination factor 2 [Vermiconidia calcicola]|uniref:Replication termination factor 2 n=1 Tax=Vermiconidia calcicola TaxID=1690605 RepID=A0ACC3N910_9PEZI|nr:Replication termination factor 2 [Vermiconidia calcicola]
MGNDGGSIPTRRELVKEAARNQTTAERKESQQEQQEYCWTTDPISRKPLAQPVVSDCNGKLYNKDVILEFLVEGSRKGDVETVTQGSIKSLKDIVEVKFDVDAEASATTNGESKHEVWRCPVTGDRLGSGSKAVYLVPCGHAFSGSAIKEVSGEKCITCEIEYASNDIIPILPTSETDIARLSIRMKVLKEKGLAHSLKKASGSGKKRKKRDEEVGVPVGSSNTTAETESKDTTVRSSTPLNGTAHENNSSGINNSSTASLAAKVKQEQMLTKKRKTESETVRGLFSSRDQSKPIGKSSDFMTRGFSVPTGAKR